MTVEPIRKGNPNWDVLIRVWLAEKKPTYLVTSGMHYRVNSPSDNTDEVSFSPFSGIDAQYGSLTKIPGAN